MRLANSAHGWGLVHIVLHWATAALIGWAAWLGWTMTDLPRFDPATFVTYNLHKSLGVTILLLAALRLVWRVSRKRPAPPPAMRPIGPEKRSTA